MYNQRRYRVVETSRINAIKSLLRIHFMPCRDRQQGQTCQNQLEPSQDTIACEPEREQKVGKVSKTPKLNIINVGYSSTNYYLLDQNLDQNSVRLLIDVGIPGTYPHLLANLKRYDIPIQSIGYLLVTHYHPDHAGVVEEVKAEGLRLIVMEPQIDAITFMQSYMKADSPYIPIKLDNNLVISISQSRSFLKSLGFDGEVITTPGHSDDSVSLILDDGSAFVGDLTFPAFATDADRAVVMNSWHKIRTLHATRIYSGHSPVQPVDLPA